MPLEVHGDAGMLAVRAAKLFLETMRAAVRATGRCAIALSGGATPRSAYQEIARHSGGDGALWAATHVFWGDERCVPAEDARNNERLARDTLLAHVPIPPAQIHPMHCAGSAEAAAGRYEDLLRAQLGSRPSLDLVHLGLGEDGHTASLFPGSPILSEFQRWVAVAHKAGEDFSRLTLTLPVINQAARVIFLVAGAAKAEALRRAFAGDPTVPAALVRPVSGQVHWLVDGAAAGNLGRHVPP